MSKNNLSESKEYAWVKILTITLVAFMWFLFATLMGDIVQSSLFEQIGSSDAGREFFAYFIPAFLVIAGGYFVAEKILGSDMKMLRRLTVFYMVGVYTITYFHKLDLFGVTQLTANYMLIIPPVIALLAVYTVIGIRRLTPKTN